MEQVFEGGTMYWWGDSGQIFVLSGGNSGRWSQYPDTWLEGEELSPLSPPAGMFSAERGFGKVWRSFPGVGDALGWAQQPEAQITGLYQRFEGGTMLYAPAINGHIDQIYVLFGDGAFAIHPDPAS